MSTNLAKNKDYEILIVEDEPILAMAMEVKLQKMGLFVSGIATCPNSAMLHAQNHFPDLAIVDINLNAAKSGIDVANYLWKNFQIPIIFLTSYYNDATLTQAMDAEPYAYLIKPCRNEELKVAINTAMHKHQYFFKNKKILTPSKENFIYLENHSKFDRIELQLYTNDTIVNLTKNEKKLFEILSKNPNQIVSFDTIFHFIWREDVYDLSKLRSLIYRLKNKIKFNPFQNLYEEGYKLKIVEKE